MIAEPKNTGCTAAARVCRASRRAAGRHGPVLDVRGEQRVVVLGERAPRPGRDRRDRRVPGCRRRAPAHRDDRRGEPGGDLVEQHAVLAGAGRSILLTKISVGMRSRRRVRISTRVCACTPSTAEITSTAPSSTPSTRSTSAMKSGWPGVSIRLTVTPPSGERHHGGLDGDAAAAFQLERVGLGAAGVDAADLVDHPGGVQQPLGQAGLTGVDMREDAEVERSSQASCPLS